jgi:hypothetical protein
MTTSKNLGHDQETKSRIHGVGGAKIQSKCVENLFSEIIAENFSNLGKDTSIRGI